ncbi:phage tail protein [Paraburkholderia ferrariae]|uniref:phage tail protein n=1 Tax=Paraburkholderia ferrariae TaxID=386056 RepID=UPI0005A9E3B9|nr:phage tail protein [Paraburkholderia ferrariae]
MIKLDVKIDTKGVARALDALVRKQLPFATAMAVNDTVRQAKADVQQEMRKVFEGPVPRTINSVRIKTGTKANPEATIWIDDEPNKGIPPARYLSAEIEGGVRRSKRFEKALQSRGLMPRGMYAVPASGCPRDGNGNIPGSFIVQLLSYLQAFGEQGYRANMSDKGMRRLHKIGRTAQGYKTIGGVAYFVANRRGRTAHLARGIYRKTGTHGVSVMPVILFVRASSYSVRLPFERIVEKSVRKNFDANMRRRLDRAIATAK